MAEIRSEGSAGTVREAQPIRQRSGLVRTASGYNAFVFSLAGISVGIMFSWGQLFGTGFYPGGHTFVSLVIATFAALIVAWGYQYWTRVFPRSGGDYVYLSRGLHPGFALGANFVYVWVLMASPAFAMSIMQPLFSSFGAAMADASGWSGFDRFSEWANTNGGYAVIGTLVLLIPAVIAVFGLKRAILSMNVLFLTGLVGTLILTVALLASDTSTFTKNLEANTGLSVGAIEQEATDNGFVFGGFDLSETMQLTVWYVTSLFFASLLVYIGGEMKNVYRNVRIALVAAVVFSGLATIVWTEAYNTVVPPKVQGALAYNAFVVPEASTAQVPYPHELMRILYSTGGFGLILTIIGFLTVLAWVTIWSPLVLAFSQRGILAWALDGLMPRWVGSVNERWHTPIPALIIAFLMGESFMLVFAFDPDFRTIILLVPLYFLLAVTMAVGAVFPFARRHFFDQSVVRDEKIFGIPAMTIVCGIASILLVGWTVMLWNDPVASGTDRTPIWVAAGILGGIALYYFGLRYYKLRQGEDISVTFKRIPIE